MAETPAWIALKTAARADAARRIRDLFDAEPDRLEGLTFEAAGIMLDLSKQPWSREGATAAVELARAAGVEAARARLFAGEIVNLTEGRPALHMALRAPAGADFKAAGKPVSEEVEEVRDAMLFVSAQINLDAGGPGFRPFDLTVFNSNIYTPTDPIGPEFDRRTLYRMNVDSAKAPLLESLDCPAPSVKTPRRAVTTFA